MTMFNRFFKKITGTVMSLALVCAAIPMAAMPASATYDSCDINRDGSVNMSDLTTLSKYLNGVCSYIEYNQLDVNGSLTVDAADEECLSTKLTGGSYSGKYFSRTTGSTVNFPSVSGFIPSYSSTNYDNCRYMRYDYNTNQQLSGYRLTPTVITLNTVDNSRKIIGDEDSRVASYGAENNGIVYIESIGGTGFIVGDHHIATAAHCVYNKDASSWNTKPVIKTVDSNGCITNNMLNVVEAHIPTFYSLSTNIMYDYALITVSDDLSDYVHFSLGAPYNATASNYANVPIYVTGAPGDIQPDDVTRLFSAEGRVMDKMTNNPYITNSTDILCYDVDTSGGNSGGPVYTITKNMNNSTYIYTAIAIHSGGASDYQNWGSMITNYQLQFYYNNPNVNYTSTN